MPMGVHHKYKDGYPRTIPPFTVVAIVRGGVTVSIFKKIGDFFLER